MPAETAASPGLTTAEAERLLAEHGPNAVASKREEGFLEELLESLREPLVLLLIVIGGLYFLIGETSDALVVLGVIFAVALAETTIEWRAGRAVAALSAMAAPRALVWRDGALAELPVERLVPGDLVELRAGSRVPADVTFVAGEELAVDESLVTGESEPVRRRPGEDAGEAALLAGTLVVRGGGRAVVTATGPRSTLGRIATLVAAAKEPRTPMQRRMAELARTLLIVALAVSVVIPLVGILAGRDPAEMLLTGLSLAFATIPEELTVLIAVVLGMGSLTLARNGAIVRRLAAAETLGAVTVVCTDKTGTLTENRLTLEEVIPAAAVGGEAADPAGMVTVVRAASLASEADARLDPVDRAVLEAAGDASEVGAHRYPFDTARRLASGWTEGPDGVFVGVKGAPEAVLARAVAWRGADGAARPLADSERARTLAVAASRGEDGGRVLAVASRRMVGRPEDRDAAEAELVFEGLLVLRDPLRAEAPAAMATLREAGVRVAMVTGDQPSTALAVARRAGISGAQAISGVEARAAGADALAARASDGLVLARALPEDKLRLVEALGRAGEVVMVTGDGANDAPALRAAAVGVAMGRAGSDVARETADVVLTNDSLATLALAVREGRRLFDNFQKAIRFYLAIKLALILAVGIAAALGLPLPFTPVQIVVLELFMDLGAAVAFVAQPAEPGVMRRAPREPKAPFLDRTMLGWIGAGALTLAALVLVPFLAWTALAPGEGTGEASEVLRAARTLALIAWFIGHAALGLAMAWRAGMPSAAGLLANRAMTVWVAASMLFAVLLAAAPPLREAIGTAAVPLFWGVGVALAAAVAPFWLTLAGGVGRQPQHAA